MKNLLLATLLALVALNFTSCSSDDDDAATILGDWKGVSQYEGVARNSAVEFTINDKAYVGLGTDGVDKLTDFWEYTPGTNTWRRVADFPGVGRYLAVAFAANGKGYVGTGYDGVNKLADFWEYDPAANQWTRKAGFGGSARYGAVALTINDKGYVGTGFDGNAKKDFWQYDPLTDTWAVKPSFGGNKRLGASAFTIGHLGYLMLGSNNGTYETDVWSYDPSTELWTQHRDLVLHDDSDDSKDYNFSAVPRQNAASFAVDGKGYVVGGTNSGNLISCWAYNPATDIWYQKTDFAGAARNYAVGFGSGDRGYVALGLNGTTRLDDTWQLVPEKTSE
jgi:N-acetylneuraminic acid mutarotase